MHPSSAAARRPSSPGPPPRPAPAARRIRCSAWSRGLWRSPSEARGNGWSARRPGRLPGSRGTVSGPPPSSPGGTAVTRAAGAAASAADNPETLRYAVIRRVWHTLSFRGQRNYRADPGMRAPRRLAWGIPPRSVRGTVARRAGAAIASTLRRRA